MKVKDWGTLEPCSQHGCEKWASSFDYNCHVAALCKCDNFYPESEWRRELYAKRDKEDK